MKHHARLWIFLWIAIVGSTTSALSAPDESEVVDTAPSSLSEIQNKTVTKSTKKSKKVSKKASKKTKSPAETRESKHVVSSALKSFKPLQKIKPERITRFVQENKVQLTIIIAVALFRKEILRLAWRLLSNPVTNAETGVTHRVLSVPPMRILQLLFLLELARRLHQSNGNGSSNVSPLAAALVMGRVSNPAVALFLSKFLSPGSSIYLPPTKQHFTFENINDRYSKDLFAYKKAVRANGLRSQLNSNVTDVIPTIVKHALLDGSPPASNETIVVMDWTSLDSSVSRMDVMRDEVSFLIKNYESQGDAGPVPRFEEVVLLLESQGGSAADYSLASQQILRLRKKGIKVTICVDKVAASGECSFGMVNRSIAAFIVRI